MKLLTVQFSPTSCHFIPLIPNIPFSTLFSDTLNLCSSHNVRDQVSHQYKIAGKTVVFCPDRKRNKGKDKRKQTERDRNKKENDKWKDQ
jgi:hypothetical protein